MTRKAPRVIAASLLLGLLVPWEVHAQTSADYSDTAGDWNIVGFVIGKGNTIACKMQKSAADGSPFAYLSMISTGGNGIDVKALFVFKTEFPEGSSPNVSLSFDREKQKGLIGGVNGGYLHIDLTARGTDELKRLVDLLQSSGALTETASLKGHPDETVMVDLGDSDTAFDKNGICMRAVMGMGAARMQQNSDQ
jgi:hypothetical protein